jgi:hypothetical protein
LYIGHSATKSLIKVDLPKHDVPLTANLIIY